MVACRLCPKKEIMNINQNQGAPHSLYQITGTGLLLTNILIWFIYPNTDSKRLQQSNKQKTLQLETKRQATQQSKMHYCRLSLSNSHDSQVVV